MIDFETEVFDTVARAVLDIEPTAFITSRNVSVAPQFPAVSVTETSNVSHAMTADSGASERYASVAYTVNVYCSSEHPRRQCKRIVSAVSDAMASMNFARTTCMAVDNAADTGIYRMIARFAGVVGADGTFYRR